MLSDYKVIVIGGGTAGVVAAIQSARAGASTLLVERTGRLGGTMVNAQINFPGLFHAWGKQIIAGIGWELVTRCCEEGNTPLPDFTVPAKRHMHHQVRLNAPLYSLLAEEAVRASGASVLLHTMVAQVKENEDCVNVTLCTKTRLQEFRAGVLIDCSGDANALALAGCKLRIPEETQPGTLSCLASGYDQQTLPLEAINRAAEEACKLGLLHPEDCSFSPAGMRIESWLSQHGNNSNHIYHINAVDSAGRSRMEADASASLLRLYRFLRQQPGLENLRIDALSAECGVRETATIVGVDTITIDDYISGKIWPDALCNSFYPIDLHDKRSGLDNRNLEAGVVPTIGRGAMLPEGRRRLLAAGRCISSDRLANSALRVQASCMATGQCAGAMAAVSTLERKTPPELSLTAIRDMLRKNHAIVPQACPK